MVFWIEGDERAEKFAEKVVNRSIKTVKDDVVLVEVVKQYEGFGEMIAEKVREREAEARIYSYDERKRIDMILRCNDNELIDEGIRISELSRGITKYVQVTASAGQIGELEKGGDYGERRGKYLELCKKEYGGNIGRVDRKNMVILPNKLLAVRAGMSLEDLSDLVYKASLIDLNEEREIIARMREMKEIFDDADRVNVVVGDHTDFSFSFRGRSMWVDDGRINLPHLEIFGWPISESVEGRASFQPLYIGDEEIRGLSLDVRYGKIIKTRAEIGENYFNKCLRYNGVGSFGEGALAFNPYVFAHTKCNDIDEKRNGTIHMALGSSHPDPVTGESKQGALHIDLICDMMGTSERNMGWIDIENNENKYRVSYQEGLWVNEKL